MALLINRNYALLWLGQAISLLGDAVFATTLVLWIATRIAGGASWAPAAVGALVVAQKIPEILVGPPAGVFADRWPKKRTMLAMDGARAVLLGVLIVVSGGVAGVPGIAAARDERLAAIYATVLLATVCSQFFLPSRISLIGDIVPDALRPRASGLAQSSNAVAMMMGPAIAAPLFFALGPAEALGLDALSFVVSFACIALVDAPAGRGQRRAEAGGWRREFLAGLRLVGENRVLRVLLVTGVVFVLGEATLNALSIFFLRENLHTAARFFGLIGFAQGGGTLLGAVAAGTLGARLGVARLLWAAAMLFGVLTLILSRLGSLPPALVVVGLIAMSFAVMQVCTSPLLLRTTPRAYVGRVIAILYPSFSVSDTIAALAAGWLASTALRGFHTSVLGVQLGPIDTIFGAAGLLALGAGVYAMLNLREEPETAAMAAPVATERVLQ